MTILNLEEVRFSCKVTLKINFQQKSIVSEEVNILVFFMLDNDN